MFITKIKLANLITYIGVMSAVMAIILSYDKNIKLAFICFIIAGVCDMLDGKFARLFERTEREKNIGIQMDSLCDVVSFLIVPVVLGISMGMNKWYNIIICLIYVASGVTRLGFFNVFADENKDNGPITVYPGVAVTYSSIVFPLAYLLKYVVSNKGFKIVYTLIMLVSSVLFLLNIKVSKPKGIAYVGLFILAVITISLKIIL